MVAKYDDQIVGDRAKLDAKIEKLAERDGGQHKKQDHMLIQLESMNTAINEIKIREIAQGRR